MGLASSIAFAFGLGVGARQWFPYDFLRTTYEQIRPAGSPLSESEPVAPSLTELQSGNYLIHIRHGHRTDTIDVTAYDYFEEALRSEGRYAAATCLSAEGRMQADLTRLVFDALELVPARVVTSGSCRANEHAKAAFGRITTKDMRHLHLTAVPRSDHERHLDAQAEALAELFPEGVLTVIVGHDTEPYRCRVVRCLKGANPREQGGLSILAFPDGAGGPIFEVARYTSLSDFIMEMG